MEIKYKQSRKQRKYKIHRKNHSATKKKFSVDISKDFLNKITTDPDDSLALYNKKLTFHIPSKDEEVNVPWDFKILKQQILDTVPKGLYGWYHEDTTSCGNSTFNAIEAFQKTSVKGNYLNKNKTFSMTKKITLHSNSFGVTNYEVQMPFFMVPYGAASEYGGKSDELNTMLGTVNANGVYTISSFTKYNTEIISNQLKQASKEKNPFFMFQLYITYDNEINISLIERAKMSGASVIMLTIDTGLNIHGGLGLLEFQSDLTYSRSYCGNLFADPVFNIKCYKEKKCVGTKDIEVLKIVAKHYKKDVSTILKSYDFTLSFDYAKTVQGKGMGNVNSLLNKDDANYDFSIKNISDICHSNKSLCKYVERPIEKGVPLVVKGCVSIEEALLIQNSNADGVYVSNHGGRYLYNGKAPLDVLTEIREAVKNNNENFGVWFDGGIRYGQDIFTAYAKGAEFVGVGRPIIYACVLYGEPGVSSITKKMHFELESQAKLCGYNNLDDYNELKKCLYN